MRQVSVLFFLMMPLLFTAQVCPSPPVLESIDIEVIPTGRNAADGALTVGVAGGAPTHLVLTESQGAAEQQLPMGSLTGVSPGTYSAVLVDVDGCKSDALDVMVPYSLCCGSCEVADADCDGLCDDVDNCANRKAINYADPANSACIIPGCMDPTYAQYDAEATEDDGSCVTAALLGCTDPAYLEYNASANTDDGSCATLASTCSEVEMDGYTYSVVEIDDQCWFAENLRTTTYADGTPIAEVTDGGTWIGLSEGARCDFANDASYVSTYGRLYNWYAVDDARGLCPVGWHVSTHEEWTSLEAYIYYNQGILAIPAALKATSGWSSNGNGTDDFGFSALPGGWRSGSGGGFGNAGEYGHWWNSTSYDGNTSWYRLISGVLGQGMGNVRHGYSVRCLKNE